ncbi:MAG: xanthine dehydrogenase family protein molybdopterin-binding subunit [Acidimicrobiales bacterium]
MTVAPGRETGHRLDARDKATGRTRYSADVPTEGALEAAVVRSQVPHAEIAGVAAAAARAVPGVVAVVTADDLAAELCGRRVRDMPLLARGKVRFTGEPVAVVLATSRRVAEEAARLVEVDYRELPAVTEAAAALASDTTAVHDAPWGYDGAVVTAGDPVNLQSALVEGDQGATEAALAAAAHVVVATYRTPSGHQGYLEPQCWTAVPRPGGGVAVHGTSKAPYRLRQQTAKTLGLPLEAVEVAPMPLGGDFGGKGGVVDPTLCAALALWAGRPVRLALRSDEDLSATDARHPAVVEVRVGCDGDGRLVALAVDAVLDGGAYAAVKPIPSVNLHGMAECALGYRLGAYSVRSRIAYTNTVPKGHMRAPGAPQAVFAIESAVDELARAVGLAPDELRRRSLLADGDTDAYGHAWDEARGSETLDAAVAAARIPAPNRPVPEGWRTGIGCAVYARPTAPPAATSLRLVPVDEGAFCVEIPFPETGTGSHTLVRETTAAALGIDPDQVAVRQVSTASLPYDPGVGASRVTVGLTAAVHQLVAEWERRGEDGSVEVETAPSPGERPALSYCAQVARVAVDPETGQVRVLDLVTAVDVATVLRPRSHRLQLDGGAVMGLGFALLEDLGESEGQVWAANLAEFRLPAADDVPPLRTVLVEGGRGVGPSNVKAAGELSNVPTAAAVANAVADATGRRVRTLPITAEQVYWALHDGGGPDGRDDGGPGTGLDGEREATS